MDAKAATAGNGKTWKNAFKTLQSALSVASSGQKIWITKGNYYGGFTVPAGVEIYGNFVSGDTRRSQRIVLNSSGTNLDGQNTNRVLQVGNACILDSLTLVNGQADAAGGGGALCKGRAPTFRYCNFFGNNTIGRGSALFVVNNSSVRADPKLEGCLFIYNGISSNNGIHTIDVCNSNGSFKNVGIADNSDNGLHFHKGSNVSMVNCYFVRNSGRGICHIDAASTAILENCLFWANRISLMHYRDTELRTLSAVNHLAYAKNNLSADPKFETAHPRRIEMNVEHAIRLVVFATMVPAASVLLSACLGPNTETSSPKTGEATAAPAGAELSGYRWEFPCKEKMPENPKNGAGCSSALVTGDPFKTDNFKAVMNFGGEKGKKYNVTLRFRGVVEPMKYKNGEMDGDYFYIGGEPNNKTYNIYKIHISSPNSHYFLNRQDRVGHKIFTIDYTKTIRIDGGATLTLTGDGQNGKLISNFKKLTIPGIAETPFNGQFIQVDVVKVEGSD